MLKDVIQEYDEYFPEIIERASYALEKVKGQPWGWVHWGNLKQRKSILSPSWGEAQRPIAITVQMSTQWPRAGQPLITSHWWKHSWY